MNTIARVAIPALMAVAVFAQPPRDNDRDYRDRDSRDYRRTGDRMRQTLPPGTNITVRNDSSINLRDSSDGRVFSGTVDQDVRDRDGGVVIPRGSRAELVVRNVESRDMILDLDSINVNGRRYIVSTEDEAVSADRKDNVGANGRTGKYVGGGAIAGAIIGAIAGGGKGAAIGALAGGGAGAGAQVLTRGREVRVPSESLLTFRLDRPLTVTTRADGGYDRDGRHYHPER